MLVHSTTVRLIRYERSLAAECLAFLNRTPEVAGLNFGPVNGYPD